MSELKTCAKGLHEYDSTKKRCPQCKRDFAKSHYWNNRDDELFRKRIYRESNLDVLKDRDRDYRLKNPEKRRDNSRRFAIAMRKWIREKDHNYRLNNKERIREKDASYRIKCKLSGVNYFKDWYKENKCRVNHNSAKRRAAKLQASPKWLTEEHWQQISFYYNSSKDLEKITGTKYHVDHIVPLQGKDVCGLHVPWNLQVIRAEDNIRKHNKLVENIKWI